MDLSASTLGIQTLNALTFKLAVTQILVRSTRQKMFYFANGLHCISKANA